ncbi:hypothetical protein A4X13_0g1281 [Tilletia indica]|uniref:Uncharacterized protein n=1 Tax=Tilletia indica TaxID=43049 RepID=A0A177TEJ8_9BASI|nr:hypothetical protein A4X13_0g1281 [Tilletia indica]
MPNIQTFSRTPFGDLPHPQHIASQHDVVILCWALNWVCKGLRLTLSHQGILLHVVLYRSWSFRESSQLAQGESFAQACFDVVETSWPAHAKIDDDSDFEGYWVPRKQSDHNPSVARQEMELIKVVRDALPSLLQEARHTAEGLITGSQLCAEITAHPTSDRPRVKLVGDLFRTIASDLLPYLSEDQYMETPRIDLSAITCYLGPPSGDDGPWKDNVFVVHANNPGVAGGVAMKQVVLKAIYVSTPPSISYQSKQDFQDSSHSPVWTNSAMLTGELDILTSLPPHPNVNPAPLAIVTVGDGKLVGWLQKQYAGLVVEDAVSERYTRTAVHRRMRYALDLCCGARFLWENGVYHPDLSLDNTLDHDGCLLLMDLEPLPCYNNKDGPIAPEAAGHWIFDQEAGDNVLRYVRLQGTPSRNRTILADLGRSSIPREALERLLVFSIGSLLSHLLDCRLIFEWAPRNELHDGIQLNAAPKPGEDPKRDTWEALLPPSVHGIAQRCCAFDPRERPSLNDIIFELKRHLRP